MWARSSASGTGVVVDPAIAVAGDLPVRLHHCGHRLGIAGERHGDTEDRDRYPPLREQPMNAPEADAAAELVHGFDGQRALADTGLDEAELSEQSLRASIAVEHAVLRALLVVDDELHGDARLAGPVRVRAVTPVAHHVAGIGGVDHRCRRATGRAPRSRGRRCGSRGGCARSHAGPRRSPARRSPCGTGRRSRPVHAPPRARCRLRRARSAPPRR